MIDRYRRRDLTVSMRHREDGLRLPARWQNRRDRRTARREIRDEVERPN